MSETSKPCSSTSTTSTRPSHTSLYIKFSKYTRHMFYIQFLREINWEWLSSDKPDAIYSHAHRRRQHQPARVPKVGTSYFQKHTWHMFYIQYFKRIRLEMVSYMSETSKSCSSTWTMLTWQNLSNKNNVTGFLILIHNFSRSDPDTGKWTDLGIRPLVIRIPI